MESSVGGPMYVGGGDAGGGQRIPKLHEMTNSYFC